MLQYVVMMTYPTYTDAGRGYETQDDRMAPSSSGALTGSIAGALTFAAVHALAGNVLDARIAEVADARGISLGLGYAIAYGTTTALGAVLGGTFGFVTRYLRKYLPLLVWAVVFFVSLTVLVLATTVGRIGTELAMPILLASVLFALIVSFSLPIRRRR